MQQNDLYQKLLAALDALPRIADALERGAKSGSNDDLERYITQTVRDTVSLALTKTPSADFGSMETPAACSAQDPPKTDNALLDMKELRAKTKQHFLDLIKRKGRDAGLATLVKFNADHFDKVSDTDLFAFSEECQAQ